MIDARGAVRLGEILVGSGVVSEADLMRGVAVARATGTRVGSALIGLGLAEADAIATALATQHDVAAVRDKHFAAIAPETRAMVSDATAKRLCAVAIGVLRGEPPELVVAMRDPGDQAALRELEAETGYQVRPAVAAESRIQDALEVPRLAPKAAALPPVPVAAPLPDPITFADEPFDVSSLDLVSPDASFEIQSPLRDADHAFAPPASALPPPTPIDTLELAVAPRSMRTTQPPAAPARTAPITLRPPLAQSRIPPDVIIEPSRGYSIPGWLMRGVGIAAGFAVGYLAFDYFSNRSSSTQLEGLPIAAGDFHSSGLAMTFRLGSGWHEAPVEERPGPMGVHMRAASFYRGPEDTPDNALMVMRVTSQSMFPTDVDMDQFKAGLDGMSQQARSLSANGVTIGRLDCDLSSLRAEPIGSCDGDGVIHGARYGIHLYVWIATADDMLVVVYAAHDADAGEAEDVVRTATLD